MARGKGSDGVAKWPVYEFHELAADEPLMSAEELELLVEDMREYGYDARFPIFLAAGKIIAGRNRYMAARKAGVMPRFSPLPASVDLEAFVYRDAYLRKHYTQEAVERKRAERVRRIAAAREQGESIRAIAEREKVSHTQVRRDLAESASSAPASVEGRDGKQYPAEGRRRVVCARCARLGKPVVGCSACVEARKAARAEAEKKAARTEAGESDKETVESLMQAVNSEIESWCRSVMRLVETLPIDPWITEAETKLILAKFRGACDCLRACKCAHRCPKCIGGCAHCRQTGRVNTIVYQSLGGR